MNSVLERMKIIFKTTDLDWMGYKVSRDNPFNFHHIREKRYGGKETIDNGAILSRRAHDHLHFLELYIPEAYDDWQRFFRYLNAKKEPLTEEDYEIIKKITYYEAMYAVRNKPRKIKTMKHTKTRRKGKIK